MAKRIEPGINELKVIELGPNLFVNGIAGIWVH